VRIYRHSDDVERPRPTVLTMGTFDGVHRGHQVILDRVVDAASRVGARSMVLTYDPHPREVIGAGRDEVRLLTTVRERLRLFEDRGVDACLVLPFTRDVSLLDAETFFRTFVVDCIGATRVVVGFDHAFGNRRSGSIDELARLGARAGIAVDVVEAQSVEGRKVSSSAVRAALSDGDISHATEMLGRPYRISGIVQRGDGLGAGLGFPTANVHIDHPRKLLPRNGVYAVRASFNARVHSGMMNVGVRPTITTRGIVSVEVHLFDFSENIYGAELDSAVIARLRDEQTFPNRDALIAQLHRDERDARRLLVEPADPTSSHASIAR
jgi:riboflavin kinase/FMN adenylyltransferase